MYNLHMIKKQRIFFYMLFALIVYLAYKLLGDFLPEAIFAFIFASIFEPVFKFFKNIFKKQTISVIFTFLTALFLVIAPLAFALNLTIAQSFEFKQDLDTYLQSNNINILVEVQKFSDKYNLNLNYENLENKLRDNIGGVADIVIKNASSIGQNSLGILLSFVLFFVMFYYFIPKQDDISRYLKKLSPLDDKIDEIYINRVLSLGRSMVLGTLIIAIVQSILTALVMYILGVDYIAFFTVLMIVMGMVPMLGTAMVSVPVGLVLIATGNVFNGIIIIVFALLVVSNVDNILRVKLVPKGAELNPILTLLSLLGGIQVFGALGFLFGPLIAILLVTSLEVYFDYVDKD